MDQVVLGKDSIEHSAEPSGWGWAEAPAHWELVSPALKVGATQGFLSLC